MERDETISIKEFVQAILKVQGDMTNQRFDALDKAIELSRDEMNRRLESLNQLRAEVMTDRQTLVQRETCESQHKELRNWRDSVNSKLTTLETRSITWTAAVGVFFVVLTFVMRWFGK